MGQMKNKGRGCYTSIYREKKIILSSIRGGSRKGEGRGSVNEGACSWAETNSLLPGLKMPKRVK